MPNMRSVPPKLTGSIDGMPKSNADIRWLAAAAIINPITLPIATSDIPFRITRRTTLARRAPSATLIPISRVRVATA